MLLMPSMRAARCCRLVARKPLAIIHLKAVVMLDLRYSVTLSSDSSDGASPQPSGSAEESESSRKSLFEAGQVFKGLSIFQARTSLFAPENDIFSFAGRVSDGEQTPA